MPDENEARLYNPLFSYNVLDIVNELSKEALIIWCTIQINERDEIMALNVKLDVKIMWNINYEFCIDYIWIWYAHREYYTYTIYIYIYIYILYI